MQNISEGTMMSPTGLWTNVQRNFWSTETRHYMQRVNLKLKKQGKFKFT